MSNENNKCNKKHSSFKFRLRIEMKFKYVINIFKKKKKVVPRIEEWLINLSYWKLKLLSFYWRRRCVFYMRNKFQLHRTAVVELHSCISAMPSCTTCDDFLFVFEPRHVKDSSAYVMFAFLNAKYGFLAMGMHPKMVKTCALKPPLYKKRLFSATQSNKVQFQIWTW